MNKEVANTYFPLYKVEIFERFMGEIETPSDNLPLVVQINLFRKENVDGEWNQVYEETVNDIVIACSHAATLYDRDKNGLGLISLGYEPNTVDPRQVGSSFPLRKIEVEEFVYGRDTGSPWSDPENDIRHGVKINYYYIKSLNGDWIEDYDERVGSFSYGIINSAITHIKLMETLPYELSPYNQNEVNEENISMFSTDGHLFTFKYHFPEQKCVCGEAITDYINDYDGDRSIKVDYLQDWVRLYKKDELVWFMAKLYMNGELVISLLDLYNKYQITPMDVEWGSDNFREWLKNNHPNTKEVSAVLSWYRVH